MLETFDGSHSFLETSRTIKRERGSKFISIVVSHDNKQKLKELYEVNLSSDKEVEIPASVSYIVFPKLCNDT